MDFDFHIEGISQENAEHLLDIITIFVEALGLSVGGFTATEDEDGEEES